MTIRFTNTLGGAKEAFEPLRPPRVSLYVCGPTVYDVTHIGHARAAIVFDVLRRYLSWSGYDVLFVRNVTDVDDKIINRARELGVDPAVVAERYTREYDDAMRALGVLPPDVAPRAGAHIPEMLDMIGRLVDGGFAYAANSSVWFAVEKFPSYGKLSRQRLDDLRAGERVEPEPGTSSPLDFAVWKAAKPGEPAWPSPWGAGRPGWHIECSAMSVRYLGIPFDIHGGGSDLIFPHHENEIAQSEAACGVEPFSRFWLHNGHVQIGGERMGKSLKNYVEVQRALEDYAPQVLRLFVLSAHYRSPIAYGPELLDEAKAVWGRFESFLRASSGLGADGFGPNRPVEDGWGTPPPPIPAGDAMLSGFGSAMDDDLATPQALAALHATVTAGNQALDAGDVATASRARGALVHALGVLGCDASVANAATAQVGPLVEYLIELRQQARASRDFAHADAIRNRLTSAGIRIEDTAGGTRWYVGA